MPERMSAKAIAKDMLPRITKLKDSLKSTTASLNYLLYYVDETVDKEEEANLTTLLFVLLHLEDSERIVSQM